MSSVSPTRHACEIYGLVVRPLPDFSSHAMHVKVRIFRKSAYFINAYFIDKCRCYFIYGLVVRAVCGIPTVAVSPTRQACESAYFKRVFCEFDNLLLRDRS